jgi:hypothetical protein
LKCFASFLPVLLFALSLFLSAPYCFAARPLAATPLRSWASPFTSGYLGGQSFYVNSTAIDNTGLMYFGSSIFGHRKPPFFLSLSFSCDIFAVLLLQMFNLVVWLRLLTPQMQIQPQVLLQMLPILLRTAGRALVLCIGPTPSLVCTFPFTVSCSLFFILVSS